MFPTFYSHIPQCNAVVYLQRIRRSGETASWVRWRYLAGTLPDMPGRLRCALTSPQSQTPFCLFPTLCMLFNCPLNIITTRKSGIVRNKIVAGLELKWTGHTLNFINSIWLLAYFLLLLGFLVKIHLKKACTQSIISTPYECYATFYCLYL